MGAIVDVVVRNTNAYTRDFNGRCVGAYVLGDMVDVAIVYCVMRRGEGVSVTSLNVNTGIACMVDIATL